ncbi:hypothetical protein HOLleu_01488 [Holothuria leucospilota]|uniref:Uncharacterized protein n=1 Tax=Holothuria leucospilota TaxID=206669 RepID=A0A9Q1CPF2_HOLLE|nr:hypothetical protein HOLleu_01488 [Holothuria leucospilota]
MHLKSTRVRATKRASLTRLGKEIKALITENPHPNDECKAIVQSKGEAYNQAVLDLEEAHKAYLVALKDEDDIHEAEAYMAAIHLTVNDIRQVSSMWQNSQDEMMVKPSDSISQAGSGSSVTSERAKANAKRAVSAAKAALLKQQQELQSAELKLKQQRDELDLKMAIAMAEAEEKAYIEAEGNGVDLSMGKAKVDVEKPSSVSNGVKLCPEAPAFQPREEIAIPKHEAIPQPLEFSQNHLIEAVHLPRVELSYFDGNPMKYWSFIRSFENSVGRSNLSDGAKLTRLQ